MQSVHNKHRGGDNSKLQPRNVQRITTSQKMLHAAVKHVAIKSTQYKKSKVRNVQRISRTPTNPAAVKPNLSVVPSHTPPALDCQMGELLNPTKSLVNENAKVNLTNGATSQRWLRQKCHQSKVVLTKMPPN